MNASSRRAAPFAPVPTPDDTVLRHALSVGYLHGRTIWADLSLSTGGSRSPAMGGCVSRAKPAARTGRHYFDVRNPLLNYFWKTVRFADLLNSSNRRTNCYDHFGIMSGFLYAGAKKSCMNNGFRDGVFLQHKVLRQRKHFWRK